MKEDDKFQMPTYKITIEYVYSKVDNKERGKLEPLLVEAENLAHAMTSQPVAEAIKQADTQILDKRINSLPPELALEVVATSAYSYSIQVCGEAYES